MWKPNQPANASSNPGNEPARPTAIPQTPAHEVPSPAIAARPASPSSAAIQSPTDQATIGKSLVVNG